MALTKTLRHGDEGKFNDPFRSSVTPWLCEKKKAKSIRGRGASLASRGGSWLILLSYYESFFTVAGINGSFRIKAEDRKVYEAFTQYLSHKVVIPWRMHRDADRTARAARRGHQP